MPDVLGGMPGIASCNLLFLYPTDFIACLAGLPFHLQLGLDASLHMALAGMGTYVFLRRLKRSHSASLLGAFFFALSGTVITQVSGGFYNFVEGIALVPWAFWAAHKGRDEASQFSWGLCGLVLALQILAGAAQLCAYTFLAVACFSLTSDSTAGRHAAGTVTPKNRPVTGPGTLGGLGLALGLAFLLAAPQLWLTLQYLPFSARQGYTHAQFDGGAIDWSETLTWLVPGWHTATFHGSTLNTTTEYFGLLPWTLAAAALLSLWRREATVRWMTVLALTAFFFAQGRWTPFYFLFHKLPIVSGFRLWSRLLFLLTFAVCCLAAFGWDALLTPDTRPAALRGARAFLILVLAAACLAWMFAPNQVEAYLRYSTRPLNFHGETRQIGSPLIAVARSTAQTALKLAISLMVLLSLWRQRPNLGVALFAALAFHAFDQQLVLAHFIKFMPPQCAAEETYLGNRPPDPLAGPEPWRIDDTDATYPNNDVLSGYENLEGSESVPLQSYQRIKKAMAGQRQDWDSLMNECFTFRHSNPAGSVLGDRVTVYPNYGAFPRAWLVGRSLRVSGDAEACRLLADPGFNPRNEVALSTDLGLDGRPARGSVLWLARSPQSFSLEVSTDQAAALVISNFWYPSWIAEVDGHQTPLLEADGGLQAIALSKGSHRVDLRFDPTFFYQATAACLAGLVFLAGLGWIEYVP